MRYSTGHCGKAIKKGRPKATLPLQCTTGTTEFAGIDGSKTCEGGGNTTNA
jgi:hypothetical protein